jgi:hypothetical protein
MLHRRTKFTLVTYLKLRMLHGHCLQMQKFKLRPDVCAVVPYEFSSASFCKKRCAEASWTSIVKHSLVSKVQCSLVYALALLKHLIERVLTSQLPLVLCPIILLRTYLGTLEAEDVEFSFGTSRQVAFPRGGFQGCNQGCNRVLTN